MRTSWRRTLIVALSAATILAACQAIAPSPSALSSPATSEPTPSATSTPAPSASLVPSASPSAVPQATYFPQPQPSLALLAAGSPALPTRVRFDQSATPCDLGPNESCSRFRVFWLEASPADITIRVYAVTTCLHKPTASTPGDVKCLVNGDTSPPSSLLLLGTAPASTRSLSFELGEGETAALGFLPGWGPEVDAVVVQAVNAAGGSLFAFGAVSCGCFGCAL